MPTCHNHLNDFKFQKLLLQKILSLHNDARKLFLLYSSYLNQNI